MSFGKSLVITLLIFLLLGALMFGAFSIFYLSDNVMTLNRLPVDMWITDYCWSGLVSCFGGIICHLLWYYFSDHKGTGNLLVPYWLLFFITLIVGFVSYYFITPGAAGGTGASTFFVIAVGPIGYWISSLFASAPAGRTTPPLGELFH